LSAAFLQRVAVDFFYQFVSIVIMNMISLEKEVGLLRSFAMSIVGRDVEGEYRPKFVQEIIRAVYEKPQRRGGF
jgi:hypothetical protein